MFRFITKSSKYQALPRTKKPPIKGPVDPDDCRSKRQPLPSLLESMQGKGIVQLCAGPECSMVLTKNGEVFSWGFAQNGRLGHNSPKDEPKPRKIAALVDRHITHLALDCHAMCVVEGDAEKIYGWGSNEEGQLFDPKQGDIPLPTRLTAVPENRGAEILGVACGSCHSVLLVRIADEHQVLTWGGGQQGQLGHGKVKALYFPTPIESMIKFQVMEVSCGANHTVMLTESGKVYTCGSGISGQLGHGDNRSCSVPRMVKALDRVTIVKIKSGWAHNMVLSEDYEVYSWGVGNEGQLGHDDNRPKYLPRKIDYFVTENILVTKIECGASFSLAISEDGQLYSWGRGKNGQLGHGDYENVYCPRLIEEIKTRTIVECSGGWTHSMALTENEDMFVWGSLGKGQLGHGDVASEARAPAQVQVPKKRRALSVACGWIHTLLITESDLLFAMGSGSNGKLGRGTYQNETLPSMVNDLAGKPLRMIACGPGHSAALTTEGSVYTWGTGEDGRLGLGDNQWNHVSPRLVDSLYGKFVTAIACGNQHSLALTQEGQVFSWGNGFWGQLGHGDVQNHFKPKRVESLMSKHITLIACGFAHNLVVDDRNAVFTWGMASRDKLWPVARRWPLKGDPKRSMTRVLQGPKDQIMMITCGGCNSVCLTENGDVYSWERGTSGDLYKINPNAWKNERISDISAGFNHTAAVTESGQLYTWGWGEFGQLGHGDARNVAEPTLITSIKGKAIATVSCGFSHTAAITTKGELYSWGKGEMGQLGRALTRDNQVSREKNSGRGRLLAKIQKEVLPENDDNVDIEDVKTPRDYRVPTLDRGTRLGFIKPPMEWVRQDVPEEVHMLLMPVISSSIWDYLGIDETGELAKLKMVRDVKSRIDTGKGTHVTIKKELTRESGVLPQLERVTSAKVRRLRSVENLMASGAGDVRSEDSKVELLRRRRQQGLTARPMAKMPLADGQRPKSVPANLTGGMSPVDMEPSMVTLSQPSQMSLASSVPPRVANSASLLSEKGSTSSSAPPLPLYNRKVSGSTQMEFKQRRRYAEFTKKPLFDAGSTPEEEENFDPDEYALAVVLGILERAILFSEVRRRP